MPDSPENREETQNPGISRRTFIGLGLGFLGAAAVGLLPGFLKGETKKSALPAGASEDITPAPGQSTPEPTQPAVPSPATSTPETPQPAATPTEKPPTPTAEPTKTPLPPKERPTALTAENFSQFVMPVTDAEFQKLARLQPKDFAFPAVPLSGNLEMTYLNKPTQAENVKGNYKAIKMDGSDMLLISAIDGEMIVRKDDHFNKDKITSIWIARRTSDNTTLIQYIGIGNNASISLISNTGLTERGNALARVNGEVGLSIYEVEILPQMVVINRPDGGKTEFNSYITYLTPSIFENSGWISKNNKAVIPQN